MTWKVVLAIFISLLAGFGLGVWRSKSVIAAAQAEKQRALSELQGVHNAIVRELHNIEESAKLRIKRVLHIA